MIQNKWLNENWHLIFIINVFGIIMLFVYNYLQFLLFGGY